MDGWRMMDDNDDDGDDQPLSVSEWQCAVTLKGSDALVL